MQPGWLEQYFQQSQDGACAHGEATDASGVERPATDGVSRRDFVKASVGAGVTAGMAAASVVAQTRPAEAQAPNPMGRNWWPSPWGPTDERGANNRMTPAKALEAARLIRTGRVYPLSQVLEAGIPLFGARHVSVTIPGGPTGGPFGTHALHYNDEMFSGEIGQIGSQFDGLGHISNRVGAEIRYYNGFTQEQVGGAYGLQKLGVHNLRPFFTRGILLDVATYKGFDRLQPNYIITPDDVQGCLRWQGIREPGEGDVVLFRTGHGLLWKKFNDEYNKGCPGPSNRVVNWLVERKIAVMGADTWAAEAVPGEDPNRPFECHSILIAMNGIFINENLNLEELAKDRVFEFAWSFNPLMLKGATGSPGNSVAIA
jgi:kynurenine formamidase